MITLVKENVIFKQPGIERELTIQNQSFYLVRTDLRGNFTYLNALFCSMMNIQSVDWIGKNALRFIYAGDHGIGKAAAKKLIHEPDQVQKVILRKETGAGLLSTQWELILLRNEAQQGAEVLCIGHDITPFVKKQENLQQLLDFTNTQNKRLQEFTYIVSHNIRSHVANLSGIIHSVDMNDQEDRNYSLELLKISIGALDHTIHYLNEIVTIQENQALPLRDIDINQEIKKTLQVLQAPIEQSNARIILNVSEGERLTTNPAYFESILLNLLSNAIKYRMEKRELIIDVHMRKQDKYKVLSIVDNGIGLDLSVIKDQLFKIFNTFNNNKDAQGMGLYITKTQIEALGGKIEVESQPGAGSTFHVYFTDNPNNF